VGRGPNPGLGRFGSRGLSSSLFSEAFFFFLFFKRFCFILQKKLAQFELLQILQNFVKVLESIRLKGCRTKGI
jgi:hypothetical protein